MNDFMERQVQLNWVAPKKSYDVIIIGGGGHGLSTAYHLAKRHGITNVAVLEKKYIGGGNSGRNTTIIRADYGVPESVKFYQRSLELYQGLEDETGRWLMHKTKGMLKLAHSEGSVKVERARSLMNQAFGAETHFLTPEEVKEVCPQVDIECSGTWPVLGASYHVNAATARHDRVNWALAEGAIQEGIHIHQNTEVLDLIMKDNKVVGVKTNHGDIEAGMVISNAGGHVSTICKMAGLRIPIRTHPLQAFVTNHYEQTFDPIVASQDLLFYVSQTARGEMLMGAELDPQPSYNNRSNYEFMQSCAYRATLMLPFLKRLRLNRHWAGICDMSPDYSPIMGKTPVENFLINTGWGTWGFKGIPASGEQMAQLIATDKTPELIEPFRLDRFARDRSMADRASAGTH